MNVNDIRNGPRIQTASTARLSCEGCTKRKTKCDKLIPCTNCRNSGTLCIPVERKRLPRGRSRRSANWLARAPLDQNNRHESVFTGVVQCLGEKLSSDPTLPSTGTMSPPSGLEIPGILSPQDTSCYATDLDTIPRHNRAFHDSIEWGHTERGGFQTGQYDDYSRAFEQCPQVTASEPLFAEREGMNSGRERQQLLHIYFIQVDPIVKILHRPSLQAHLLGGESYLDYDPWHPAPAALASAVYYAASCAVNQATCFSCFGMEKVSLIAKYQKESKAALERADYLLTDDLTVLQAFVISLIAMRCHDRTRRFWTMLALALRIAQALSLHNPNPPFPVKPLERQMRRRLWHAIGLLDIQAALSSASEPMIQSSWLRFEPLVDMDDDDCSTDFESQIPSRRKVPETSLFHVISYAHETARHLAMSNSSPYANQIQQRQQLITTFKKQTDELFVGHQLDQNNLNCYAKELAHSIGVYLQLLAVRPLDTSLSSSQATGVNMLRLAVEALDSRFRVYSSVKAQPWRWIAPLFFPWQALAISLAGILVCDDLGLVRRIWPLVEQGYESFTALGIESPQRQLRKPMKDLMERARNLHDRMLLSFHFRESGRPALPWGLSPPEMVQYHAPHRSSESWFPDSKSTRSTEDRLPCNLDIHESDIATWIAASELDPIDLTLLESSFEFDNIATVDNGDVW
ncbi:hypothetical protein BDV26DRAFT_5613 [Aspergillus bertholletiae]|uniref:Zn(2)-C6 fungal-type domain-containing protein n=1 Tax=Aspergillus bertholletiae TaxID=1226010 RepID=A0A5N7BL28_9EURO|nr:hypothetical protein BDV26DRAFT_5613 [Aspergillus bertholletiae]